MLVIFFFRKLFIKAVTFKDYVIAIQKEFVWHCPSDMHILLLKLKCQKDSMTPSILKFMSKKIFVFIYDSDF